MLETYNIRKVGLGVITFLSIATAPTSTQSTSITSGTSISCFYESLHFINDNQGEVCMSSDLSKQATGDIITESENVELIPIEHNSKCVKLYIKDVRKHISNFDFEEEYEEI